MKEDIHITEELKPKDKLNVEIKEQEEQGLYLERQIEELNKNLEVLKKRYKKEVVLKDKANRNLHQIKNSRSWKFSFPIRKIGAIVKSKNNNSTPNEIQSVIKDVMNENTDAKSVERNLWGGYSSYALKDLNEIKTSNAIIRDRIRATRAIARWYYDQGNYEAAYEELEYMNQIKPIKNPSIDRIITEIKVLKKLGKIDQAKKEIWDSIEVRGLDSELCLGMAHLNDDESERLNWYNILYDKNGLNQIKKLDVNRPLAIDNIFTQTSKISKELEKYKISIIIPAYKVADSIHIAMNSLLSQTVQNIEIIVVDDCSPDNTVEVVEDYIKKDSRIKLVKKEKNEGAYAARNTALSHVTGDFVTIHDGDDWSHSQKLEIQLKELIDHPTAVGSISYLVRALSNVSPINAGSVLGPKFLMMNSSSLLVRKEVFEKIGGWDSVRVAGDSEFIWRLEKVYGKDRVHRINSTIPLSIALSAENSLTSKKATHVRTIYFGLRRSYREAFEWWHSQVNSIEELYMDPTKINRHFPCPIPNMVIQPEIREYNTVFIADFSEESNVVSLIELIIKNTGDGDTIALFHWPYYEGTSAKRVSDEIHLLIKKMKIDILVPNEKVKTHKILVLTPRVLDYVLESVPEIEYDKAIILKEGNNSSETKNIQRKDNLLKTMNVSADWCEKEVLNQI